MSNITNVVRQEVLEVTIDNEESYIRFAPGIWYLKTEEVSYLAKVHRPDRIKRLDDLYADFLQECVGTKY